MTIALGILHPGEMGASLAQSALNTLGKVYWCSQGRSEATRDRAAKAGLTDTGSLDVFVDTCQIIISICPPHAALAQAELLIAKQYQGIYVDANAVAPATAIHIGSLCEAAGMQFVDGGIVGLPTTRSGTTWLYLSGTQAALVQECFAAGPFETRILGPEPGQASALKMCYAAWNKGKTALFTAVLAAAQSMEVREALKEQWELSEPGFAEAAERRMCQVARKAWRFTGEMQEIASTLEQCNLPGDFFTGAAEIYQRQSCFKNTPEPPTLPELLDQIAGNKKPASN